jgi:diguanylate cyclase (GGDEF)-like protein
MEPLSLIMIDIDRFKSYNETYGKPAGDSLLQTFGKLLRESLRVVDFVARYGGEEFVVLLPNTHTHRSQEIAERLRFLIELHSWPLRQVTASFGATTFNQSEDPYSLIEEAEEALSHSKQTGRNRVTHSAYTTTIRKAA